MHQIFAYFNSCTGMYELICRHDTRIQNLGTLLGVIKQYIIIIIIIIIISVVVVVVVVVVVNTI